MHDGSGLESRRGVHDRPRFEARLGMYDRARTDGRERGGVHAPAGNVGGADRVAQQTDHLKVHRRGNQRSLGWPDSHGRESAKPTVFATVLCDRRRNRSDNAAENFLRHI